jgi:hypothetical protein
VDVTSHINNLNKELQGILIKNMYNNIKACSQALTVKKPIKAP